MAELEAGGTGGGMGGACISGIDSIWTTRMPVKVLKVARTWAAEEAAAAEMMMMRESFGAKGLVRERFMRERWGTLVTERLVRERPKQPWALDRAKEVGVRVGSRKQLQTRRLVLP